MNITFNAFSFLRSELEEKGVKCGNSPMQIKESINIAELVQSLGIELGRVEGAFVNHRLMPKETVLCEGDQRVALVSPDGIPCHIRAYIGATKCPTA
ncbi:MAG: MoaD/ThiS family protein [Sulfurospirillum sp.]